MRVAFTKMHGASNDYIYLDCLSGVPVSEAELPELARKVSDRHRGIGSDGLILVLPPPDPAVSFGFRMFNSDGSEGEMCGNGMRCFARLVVARKLTRTEEFTVATKAGPIQCWVQPAAETEVWDVTCDLGLPGLTAPQVPTTVAAGPDGIVKDALFVVDERRFALTAVSTGVPHAVLFVDDLGCIPWRQLGQRIETDSAFPSKTNVEFARVLDRTTVEVRVWERGSGETLACGTGACAVVIAGVLTGRLDRRAQVRLAGGELTVHWRESDGHVLLSGPAVEVCSGEYIFRI